MNKIKTYILVATVTVSSIGIIYTNKENSIESRSPKWAMVRAKHLKEHPECEACGQKDHLNVHHIIPFHVRPELELEPTNLITLCTDGPFNLNCHGLIGHSGNYKCANPNIREDCKVIRKILGNRVCD